MAEEILPSAFFSDYKNKKIQEEIIANQLNRVEEIIKTAEIIPLTQEILNKVIEWGVSKQAPMHKKNSLADTIIILSLFDFAEKNSEHNYFFITANTEDFCKKENKKSLVHPDLAPYFTKFNIKYFKQLNQLIHELKTFYTLPVSESFTQKRKERIKNKIKERIYNPEYEKLTTDYESSFIVNINTLEFILTNTIPTKEQVIYILGLIDSENNYEREFYKRLDNINWFPILKSKGVFNPENNPSPIKTENGYQLPVWEALRFLEKISIKINEDKNSELTEELLEIIQNVSKKPKDNYITWYSLITILSNLPNTKISKNILQFIPIWLSGNFGTDVQSSPICEKLLPKFLSENPTIEDIEKAEIILYYILEIEKVQAVQQGFFGMQEESYKSKIDMTYIIDTLGRNLIFKIAMHCSNDIIYFLAKRLKKLWFDFPNGINIEIKSNEQVYKLKMLIEESNLSVSIPIKEIQETIIDTRVISNFENYDEKRIKEKIIDILNELNISYFPTDQNELNLKILFNALANGSYYSFSNNSISQLQESYQHEENPEEGFALIFRDLLNEKIKIHTSETIELLKIFSFNNYYRLSFYQRIVFYVISENWELTKPLFWEIVNKEPKYYCFSNYNYNKELYDLLKKNVTYFSSEEIVLFQSIINSGPKDELKDKDPNYLNYWKLQWYAALKDIEPFNSYYTQLSVSENLTNKHFENRGKAIIRSGLASPFSTQELISMSNTEIVNYILEFKPKDRWEEPNIVGLSDTLEKAVAITPEKFSDEIELYKDVYYIYAYNLLNGFREAWKNHKIFDWKKVLNFCKTYIRSSNFYSGQLKIENEGLGTSPEWVAGAMANLFIEGMQTDSNAFDIQHMPLAKEIILILTSNLKYLEDFNIANVDYPTYTLNSTAGKVIRSLLNYSLRRARTLKKYNNLQFWEDDVIFSFEQTLKKGIIDSFILTGWYYQHFYFLNKVWITDKIIKNYTIEDEKWRAFFIGFTFANPPYNKELYDLFFPHYERAIQNGLEMQSHLEKGVIRHIVAFYFWGFENIESKGLLLSLIHHASPSSILELISFIWRQEDYIKSLSEDEAVNFEEIIFKLWTYLFNKYESSNIIDEHKILASLSHFLVFAPKLNQEYTTLIIKSIPLFSSQYDFHHILENLVRLKTKGTLEDTAINIGTILYSISFPHVFSSKDQQNIIELISFLFENNEKKMAAKLCNKLTRQGGHEFIISLFNKFKPV